METLGIILENLGYNITDEQIPASGSGNADQLPKILQ
jgi:hypothetical protein